MPGNDFIVSLGDSLNDPFGSVLADPFIEGGAFMHELGHNIGLHHDGDVNDGNKARVSATPAFFINGMRVTGAQPASTFEKIIDQELGRLTRNTTGY